MINLFFVVHDYSGAQTYAHELLEYLSTQESIVVHKLYLNSSEFKEYTEIKEGDVLNIYIPGVKCNTDFPEKYAARCIDLISHLICDKSNIIFHLNYCTQVSLGLEARKRYNAQLIFTLHFLPNYFSIQEKEEKHYEGVFIMDNKFDKEIILKVDGIICVTHFAQKMLKQHYNIRKEKTRVIYNGYSKFLNSEVSMYSKEKLKKKYGFNDNDKIVLFVGRVGKDKGVENLIEIFDDLSQNYPNLKLVLVGMGEYDSCLELCQNNFGSVSFTGKLHKKQIEQLYHIADIGVIPSEYEQCSYVALEMMKYGLPIIASMAPGLQELFENGKDALLFPLKKRDDEIIGLKVDSMALLNVMDRLIQDIALQKKLGANAHIKWKKYFTHQHMGENTLNFYLEMTK